MRTSYRELSRGEFEISVITETGQRTVLGTVCINRNGKWSLDQSYFPVGAAESTDIHMSNSMVNCGRAVVKAWERAEIQRKFNEKLRRSQLENEERKKEINTPADLDDSYYESLWGINSFDPFEGEP
tara:strand:- start:1713 stop:2093 length:381 start_codon:yes stop_codon:yes gene_type:complete